MTASVLAFSFPNPFGLLSGLLSPLLDLGGAAAESLVADVIEGLAGAVIGALVDLAAGIMSFFWDAAEPRLQSSWFHGSPNASYDQMVTLAAPLLVAFVLAGIIQGALKGDVGGMLRMTAVRLPGAVLAMSITVAVGDLLLEVTDEMSAVLLADFKDDITRVGAFLSMIGIGGASLPALLLSLVFAGVGLLAAVVVVIELFVRAALVYLIAAFSPLVYAAAVWEPLRGSVRKLAEIALALILSKLAIAVALAVSAAALVGSGSTGSDPGTATVLVTPEQAAVQLDQPVAQTMGVLVGAVVMFCVAAFMPFVLWRLLPLAEGAMVSHGVRGAPLRGGYMAASIAMMAMNNPATRLLRSRRNAGRAEPDVAAGAANPAAGAARAGASAATKGAKTARTKATRAAGRSANAGRGSRRGNQANGAGQRSAATGAGRPGVRTSSSSGQRRSPSGASQSVDGAREPGGGARSQGGGRDQGGPAPGGAQPSQPSQRSQRPSRGRSSGSPRRGGKDRS